MSLFSFGFRYKGKPDKGLYGLQASVDQRERQSIRGLEAMTRETSQLVVDIARSNWSVGSPADADKPPSIESGNLDSAARIYERDLSGRFSSSANSKATTIIWDATKGQHYHGRGEYAAVQEYGLDGLLAPHPFLGPALDEIENGFLARVRKAMNG